MEILKELRNKSGMNQRDMAKILNISYSHYVKLENNFVNPGFKLIKKIKKEFPEVDLNRIFK
ncbi:helix-turn-helix domain-containing protein [Companilactobacillus sp. FL22-1]|uniref:helix-turn-helix domain-containing protein n=1 Tax=Companilactobacillus sp. FL22-1 TaxID=3373892 RepID=UPI003753F5A5